MYTVYIKKNILLINNSAEYLLEKIQLSEHQLTFRILRDVIFEYGKLSILLWYSQSEKENQSMSVEHKRASSENVTAFVLNEPKTI